MEIITKFKVYDLVQRKYDVDTSDFRRVLEVMEVQTQTCYAGTQVFYLCKPLVAIKKYPNGINRDPLKSNWEISHGIGKGDNTTGWMKYVEPELLPCSDELINIITNKENHEDSH